MSHLRFRYFIAPYHRAGTNPTVVLHRDLDFVEHIDALGYDEVWFGEHHSAGTEIIGSPEIFSATAARGAPRITFGTGVVLVSYHNPLWVADRIVLLDHLTRGRLVRLLNGEAVTATTATHILVDAEWSRYFANIVAFPQMAVETGNVEQMISFINNSGVGVIGTPDQARGHVERLWKQTNGFGSLLLMGHDWAAPQATKRSAELFAEEVIPHFQGQAKPTIEAADRAAAVREGFNKAQFAAIDHMTAKYEQELKEC